MFERFTVDVLSGQVATLLIEGEPSARLTHRFFRKGRRDGRKAYDHDSVAKMLEDAVHLAGSTLVEQLVVAQGQAEMQVQALRAALAGREAPEVDEPAVEAVGTPSMISGGTELLTDLDSDRLLADALLVRRRAVQRREAQRETAELRAAESELAQVLRRLELLPVEYAQRFESIRHTGELLWARYCNGFVQGESRRGSRSSDVELPAGSLRIDTPATLRGHHHSDVQAEAPVPLHQGA